MGLISIGMSECYSETEIDKWTIPALTSSSAHEGHGHGAWLVNCDGREIHDGSDLLRPNLSPWTHVAWGRGYQLGQCRRWFGCL